MARLLAQCEREYPGRGALSLPRGRDPRERPAGPHPARAGRIRNFWEKTTPVAVKIKLKRLGKIRSPYYRVVVADSRAKRDGRAIEEIGKYHPKQEPSLIEINSERAQYWLSVGAQPTDPVRNLLKITGDWQRFRGEDGADGTLKTAAPRPGKKEAFATALKEAHGEAEGAATTQKERGRRADAKADKADARPARASRSSRSGSGGGKADTGKADTGKAGAEADAEKAAAPEGESGKARTDGKADTGQAGTAEANKAAGKPERASPRATKAAGKVGGRQDKREKAAATDGADSGEPGDAAEDGETAKAGSRGSRKRSSGAKAGAASGSSDKADADEAGSEG
jgi:small subunit ribosomal protein S16